MLKITLGAVALLSLGACGGGSSSESADADTEPGSTETPAVELFSNGLPQYPTFDEASLETEETVTGSNQVEFTTNDAIPEVYDFYKAAMMRERLEQYSSGIVGEPAEGTGGANITAETRSEGTEVTILIFDESTNSDPASNYVDGVPNYPGVAESDLRREKAADGRRDVIRFTTPDSADAVIAFYRSAFAENGMTITSMQTRMSVPDSLDYASVFAREQLGRGATAVTLNTKGDRWAAATSE